MLVVLTRLEAHGLRAVPRLMALSAQTARELSDAPGFLGGRLLADRRLVFWTLTAWETGDAVAGFRARHAPVTAQVGSVARSATSTGWRTDVPELPRWRDVAARLPDVPAPAPGLSRSLPPSALSATAAA